MRYAERSVLKTTKSYEKEFLPDETDTTQIEIYNGNIDTHVIASIQLKAIFISLHNKGTVKSPKAKFKKNSFAATTSKYNSH